MSTTTTEVLTARLAEAEAAYHSYQMGQAAVEVTDANGERVIFNRTSIDRLRSYIAELKSQLGLPATTKAMGFLY